MIAEIGLFDASLEIACKILAPPNDKEDERHCESLGAPE